ncbi:MAG: SusC/RagA family TonB-linked outer membrane protein, partial [Cytophagales bacterium]|nr:SusC/RagA family TonB-linked outer membrane protein [Cytophagales bacterium]
MKHLNTTACTKLVLSMVCVVACWRLPASAQSLAFDTGKRTTIQNEQKLSLRKALGELETKYKVVFGYQSNVVTNRYVNENNDWLYQPDAESAIRLLLGPLNLSYKRVGKDTYIIKSRKKTKMTNAALPPGTAAPDLGAFSEKNAQNDFVATLVSGTVKSDAGESLPGVSVSVKGTTSGTTTDAVGKYSISVPEQGAILVFSFIGYVTEEIVVGNRTTVDVTLIPDIKSLSEVVVVGYGTQNRKDLTGSVASVRGEEIKNMPTNSLTNALQGRIPGAYITQTDGNPASGANIVIRGPVSINGGSPLYVVDGIPFQGTNFNFNVQDIESVDVLKDAAAAAIYGALGGSGVILITTKKGKSGQLRVGFNANYGVRNVFNLPQTLRRDEYIRAKEAFGFPAEDLYGPRSGWSRLPDTDWFGETYRQGRDQNYTISLSGGGEKSTFYVSTNYARIDGTRLGNWIDRYTLRLNSDHQISKRFKFSQTLYGRYGQEDPNSSTNQGDLSFRNTPVMAVYDPTNPFGGWGKLPRGFQGGHDLQAILGNFSRNESYEVTLGGTLEAKIIDGLNFRSTLGTGIVGYNNYGYNYVADIGNGPSFDDFGRFMGRDMKFIGTFTLNYDKTFGNHNENFANVSGNNRGALVPVPQNFDLVRTVSTATMRSYAGDAFRILSQFARLEYAFKDKYLVTANLRRDGYSTKFGPENRYGVFPGVSVGWKISEEDFMRNIPVLSF